MDPLSPSISSTISDDTSPIRSSSTSLKNVKQENGGGVLKNPNQVARRNQRERNRVRQVNNGFVTLRNHIPQHNSKSKKLSKVETLRAAAGYIQYLQQLLNADHHHNQLHLANVYNNNSNGNLFAQTLHPYNNSSHENVLAHFGSNGNNSITSDVVPSNYYNPVFGSSPAPPSYGNTQVMVDGNYSISSYKISPSNGVTANHSPPNSFVSDASYEYVLSPPEVKQYHHNGDFTIMHTYS